MSLTARHKKPGGFRKLVNSLETTPEEKRKKILDAMRKEDPDFVAEVENCLFSFQEFAAIDDLTICEIISSLNPIDMRSLALALHKADEKLLGKFTKNMLPAKMRGFKEETELLKEVKKSEQDGSRFRIIGKARELEAQNVIKLKRYSQHFTD